MRSQPIHLDQSLVLLAAKKLPGWCKFWQLNVQKSAKSEASFVCNSVLKPYFAEQQEYFKLLKKRVK